MNDLIAGHSSIMFDTVPTVIPNTKAGKLSGGAFAHFVDAEIDK